jgi:hypothetical protein
MSDAATDFTTIERAIVKWLEDAGFNVLHDDGEWVLTGAKWPFVKQEASITELACKVYQSLVENQ